VTEVLSVENLRMNESTVVAAQPLQCEECTRPWLDGHERWRLYLDTDEPVRAVPYCPACASREFDPD
jgi:hypothetical protein